MSVDTVQMYVEILKSELKILEAERHGDPLRGLDRLMDLRRQAPDNPEVFGRTLFLEGLFLKELLRPIEAQVKLREAIGWAVENDLTDVEARSRANMAVLLTELGETAEADRQMQLALGDTPPSAEGLVTYLRGLLLQRQGAHYEALDTYERAVPLLQRVGDFETIEMLRLNHAVGLIYLGDIDGARAELATTEASADQIGLGALSAMAAQNLGFLDGRRGYLADAMAAFDRAEKRYEQLSWQPKQVAVMHSDRAEVLLQAGLSNDARESVTRSVRELEADGNGSELAEARLLLARTCIAVGDYEGARREVTVAALQFRRARRPAWVNQATYVGRQVDYFVGQNRLNKCPRLSGRFEYIAGNLVRHGWPVEGHDALVFAALAALDVEDTKRAGSLLHQAARLKADKSVQHRVRVCLAKARILQQTGRDDKAATEVRRGVRQALEVLSASGSAEARVEGLRFAGDLAALGTDIALKSGRPIPVLRSVELQRSLGRAVTPSTGAPDGLVAALDGLRSTGLASKADIENRIRQQSLRSRAEPEPSAPDLSWRQFRRATSNVNFVYFLETNELISGLMVRGTTTRLVQLGRKADIVAGVEFLQFAADRLFSAGTGDGRVISRLRREAGRLAQLLIEPLDLKPGALVVVPSPALSGVLWSLLSVDIYDISVATSGASWLGASTKVNAPVEKVTLVSGPGLEASDDEVARIAALYPTTTVLAGKDATVSNVLDSFASADLIHIAAHGRFRAESPMFSRLELWDGPLTIYDLQTLRRLPRLIVLPACESAADRIYESGAALGTASALVCLGAQTVVAPVQPIVDSATCDHMVSFHQKLISGASPAHALRRATETAYDSNDPERVAAAAMFVVSGAGQRSTESISPNR